MKNSLNNILSMMNKIDHTYINEGVANDTGVQQNIPFADVFTPEVLKKQYNDETDYKDFVPFIDFIKLPENDTKLGLFIKYIMTYGPIESSIRKEKNGIDEYTALMFANGTVGQALYNVYRVCKKVSLEYWRKDNNVLEESVMNLDNFDLDPTKIFLNFNNRNPKDKEIAVKRLFNIIKVVITDYLNQKEKNNDYNFENKKNGLKIDLYQNFGTRDDDTVNTIFEMAINIAQTACEHFGFDDKKKMGDEISSELQTAFRALINKHPELDTKKWELTKVNWGKEEDVKKYANVGAYDGQTSGETELNQLFNNDPYNIGKISASNSLPKPSVLRGLFSDEKYRRLRTYLYYVYYSALKGYNDAFREYIFGKGNCLSKETKILDYNHMQWDDPLYGDSVGDPYFSNQSLANIYELLKKRFASEEIVGAYNNFSVFTESLNVGKGAYQISTSYETLELIAASVKKQDENLIGKMNTTHVFENNFTNIYDLLVFINNYETIINYSNEFTGIEVSRFINNEPLKNIFKGNENVLTILSENSLCKFSEDGKSDFGLRDFFNQMYSFTKEKGYVAKIGDGVEGKVFNFCNNITTNYISTVFNDAKHLQFIDNIINKGGKKKKDIPDIKTFVSNATKKESGSDLGWKMGLNDSRVGGTGTNDEIQKMLGKQNFDIYNLSIKTVIEYQGPHHFPWGDFKIASPKLLTEELKDKNRENAYHGRRNDFISFIIKNSKRENANVYDVIDSQFEKLRRKYVLKIIDEFYEQQAKNLTVDRYSVPINMADDVESLKNRIEKSLQTKEEKKQEKEKNKNNKKNIEEEKEEPLKIITITTPEKLNSPQRWLNETSVWIKEMKDNAKIWFMCNNLYKKNDSSFMGQSLLIHLYDTKLINGEAELGPNAKECEKASKFRYSLKYGENCTNYGIAQTKLGIKLIFFGKDWIKNLQNKSDGYFQLVPWSNNLTDGNKQLESILIERYREMDNGVSIAVADEIKNYIPTNKPTDVGPGTLQEENTTLFKSIVNEIFKNGGF